MSVNLLINGKKLNTINGKKIRKLIYFDKTYEIAKPVEWPGYLTFSSDSSAT
jgi:hypothetical protein